MQTFKESPFQFECKYKYFFRSNKKTFIFLVVPNIHTGNVFKEYSFNNYVLKSQTIQN
ncbi:hypothetical protein M2101_001191 [Parabacteroides sp. PM5-20]|nr:hypothetical protein [Parabacteroides sp. PM5-20]